jgi:hypothetical protein
MAINTLKIKSPAWRLEDAKRLTATSDIRDSIDCIYTESMLSFLGGEEVCSSLQEAYLLYSLPESKAILSALLVNDTPIERIAEATQCAQQTIVYFSKIFFDTSVFLNRLILKEFINILPERDPIETQYKLLLRSAYNLGSEYIVWKKGLVKSRNSDIVDITSNLVLDSYWRAREHKSFPLDSNATRESRAWMPQVLRTLEASKNAGNTGETAVELLRLKLVKQDTTVSISALNSEEIKG